MPAAAFPSHSRPHTAALRRVRTDAVLASRHTPLHSRARAGASALRPRSVEKPTEDAELSMLPARRISCAHCSSVRTTTIGMTLTDGSAVEFTSCRSCEGKTWTGEHGPIPLDGVLARATRRRA